MYIILAINSFVFSYVIYKAFFNKKVNPFEVTISSLQEDLNDINNDIFFLENRLEKLYIEKETIQTDMAHAVSRKIINLDKIYNQIDEEIVHFIRNNIDQYATNYKMRNIIYDEIKDYVDVEKVFKKDISKNNNILNFENIYNNFDFTDTEIIINHEELTNEISNNNIENYINYENYENYINNENNLINDNNVNNVINDNNVNNENNEINENNENNEINENNQINENN